MSAENQILQTTKEDITRIEESLYGNSVRNMRRALDKIRKRLVILQRRLVELRSNESIIKSRIYNNADALFIDANYSAGKTQATNPQQSYTRVYGANDPHQNYAYSKFNMYTVGIGVKEMDCELNRIDKEIKSIQADIRAYEVSEQKITDSIRLAEAQKEKNLKNTLGRILPPTQEDLEKDKIARARTANILLLYKIALNYRDLSRVPLSGFSTGFSEQRVYPDERKLPRQLKILRQIFWSHANAPGLQFDRKEELTFDDPATSENLNILYAAVSEGRATSANSKISLEVDAYVKQVDTIANDPLVSEGIERKPDATLPLANSLSEKTKSYPGAVLRFQDFYLGSFEIPTFDECIKKWWKKSNADLYFGLPQCPNVTEPYPTTGDEKTDEYEASKSEAVIAGTEKYKESLEKAKAQIDEDIANNVGDLPATAPDWVKTYAESYGSSSRGSLDYEGSTIIVGRATGADEATAQTNADKLITFPADSTVTKKDEYSYVSLTGYLVTYTNGRQLFVYPENKENFDNQPVTTPIRSIEEQTEWIVYVQWG